MVDCRIDSLEEQPVIGQTSYCALSWECAKSAHPGASMELPTSRQTTVRQVSSWSHKAPRPCSYEDATPPAQPFPLSQIDNVLVTMQPIQPPL